MLSSETLWKVAAASAGVLFVGYCVYFDKKRRNDTLFKQELAERSIEVKENHDMEGNRSSVKLKIGDPKNMQAFFLYEMEMGEQCFGLGDTNGGIGHFANALAVHSNPQQILFLLSQYLPEQVVMMIGAKAKEIEGIMFGEQDFIQEEGL